MSRSVNEDAFQWAAKYAALEWRVVVNYGVDANGVCTCYQRKECRSPGKHPRGQGVADERNY